MKPSTAWACSAGITALLIAAAWLLLFPVYDTNDDVAIRLLLEGRMVPGAEPSGYAYFVNLALGQVVASLYRLAPGISWYDVVEQGTLTLTAIVAFYCCIRFIRFPDDALIVALMAAMLLAAFAAIQFTIVGALGAIMGSIALMVALTSARSTAECYGLSTAGALLLLAGTLFRLEAALLGILIFGLSGLAPVIKALRKRGIKGRRSALLIGAAAVVGVASAWGYHFAEYFGSAAWRDFYLFNILRGQLSEYAMARVSSEILAHAFAAVGWTPAEHEMLRQWLFFDSTVFSTHNLNTVVQTLPVLPNPGFLAAAHSLSSYGSNYPFLFFGLAGVILTSSRIREGMLAILSLVAISAVVILISIFLKPLDYRVFWPIAAGTLLVIWIGIHLHQASPPHWLQRVSAAALLIGACVLVTVQLVNRSWAVERDHRSSLADVMRVPIGPAHVAVIVGAAFPYELVERPFGPPHLQRSIQALPLGTTARAPPIAEFVNRIALPDIATWLCSDAVFVIASEEALRALQSYYQRHRNQTISFTATFEGKTFTSYRCRITSSRGGLR